MPSKTNLLVVLVAAVLPGAACLAQDAGGGKDGPRGWLRLLPVGETPPFRQVIEGEVRRELEAPPGSIPPRLVEIPGVGNEEPETLQLSLGRVSEPVVAVAGTLPVRECDGGGAVQAEPWHQLKVPRQTAALAVLWRDPDEKKWTKARSLLLPDGVADFAAGCIRFVNVSPYQIGVKFAGEDILLSPGKGVIRGRPRGELKQVPLLLAVGDDSGQWVTIFNSTVSQAAAERTNVVVFRADGMRPRRPAKALILRERAVFPKLPKRE